MYNTFTFKQKPFFIFLEDFYEVKKSNLVNKTFNADQKTMFPINT